MKNIDCELGNILNSQVPDLAEYGKIFGVPKRVSLFKDDEESYLAFRQSIIDSPLEMVDYTKLPFEGIDLSVF